MTKKIKLFTNAPSNLRPLNKLNSPATLCDIGEELDASAIRVTRDIELDDLKVLQSQYQASRNKLPTSVQDFKDKVLLAANFPVDDVIKMILQNYENLLFLRIYICINEEGDHILVMAPIDKNKQLIQEAGTYYTEQCCGYPPHTDNFRGDPILGI